MATDRRTWRVLTLLSVCAGAVAFGVINGAPAGADETVVTFAATGGAQTWTVPDDVTQVRVDAYGGDEAGGFARVAPTQGARDVGSSLPKSFNLTTVAGGEVWVHPNATKHIWHETRELTFGRAIGEQQRLKGLADAVDGAVVGRWDEMQVSGGWELIFSAPRSEGLNPVLIHARYLGG